MSNIFSDSSHNFFRWENLGNIENGRHDLGTEMPVMVYRLFEYTLNNVLVEEFGADHANEIFRKSGYLAGSEFAKHVLPISAEYNEFINSLDQAFIKLKIGILRVEQFDYETGDFILTIAQDLDCSGLPATNEVVCCYDEGFLAGIFDVHTSKNYIVREIDCWASGDRICRFKGTVE